MTTPPSYAALARTALDAVDALATRARDRGDTSLWGACVVIVPALVELHTRALLADRTEDHGHQDAPAHATGEEIP